MCTDKTLKAHIAEYKRIDDQIAALKAERMKHSDFIINEFQNRDVKKLFGIGVYIRKNERINKKDCPIAIWDKFKTVTESPYLKECKTV